MQKSNIKVPPHHRLTLDDVMRDFRDGLLTARGLIFYSIAASRKHGEPIRMNPVAFTTRAGINRATYYRAISVLTLQKRIEFETNEMVLRVPVDDDGTPIFFLENESTKCDSESTKCDSEPSETLLSSSSSALLSIQSLQSIQSLKERENAREEEENGDRGFRDWLFNRANSLPQKPALLEQWIDKEMLKAANKREFAQYQASMAVTPIPAILQTENIASQDYWAAVEARRNGNG